MIEDEILDGSCCALCTKYFKDTEGAVVSHGEPVVCKECWSKLPPSKKSKLKKAFFNIEGYMFNITIPGERGEVDLLVIPLHNGDQILYEVHSNGLLCAVGLNEDLCWEPDRNVSRDLVEKIGKAIQLKEDE
jgi:hypothetical protein